MQPHSWPEHPRDQEVDALPGDGQLVVAPLHPLLKLLQSGISLGYPARGGTGGILVLGADLYVLVGQWDACGVFIEGLSRVHFRGLFRTGVGVGQGLPPMAMSHLILQPWGVSSLAMDLNHRSQIGGRLCHWSSLPQGMGLSQEEPRPEVRCSPPSEPELAEFLSYHGWQLFLRQ